MGATGASCAVKNIQKEGLSITFMEGWFDTLWNKVSPCDIFKDKVRNPVKPVFDRDTFGSEVIRTIVHTLYKIKKPVSTVSALRNCQLYVGLRGGGKA